MTPAQKKKTNLLKVRGSQQGKQKIRNPKPVQTILKKSRSKLTKGKT